MSRLYRAALPEDYVHNPETGLWELSFDQRPVAGTRAASPEEGAAQYNAAREKFKSAVSAVRQRPEPVFSFTNDGVGCGTWHAGAMSGRPSYV